jgi:hypothetical protein
MQELLVNPTMKNSVSLNVPRPKDLSDIRKNKLLYGDTKAL